MEFETSNQNGFVVWLTGARRMTAMPAFLLKQAHGRIHEGMRAVRLYIAVNFSMFCENKR
jgi:hypothetical protein